MKEAGPVTLRRRRPGPVLFGVLGFALATLAAAAIVPLRSLFGAEEDEAR
jgi:hypothetical protein